MNNVFEMIRAKHAARSVEELSLQEYLELARQDRMVYASAPERMLAAIGEPEVIDTSTQPRLGRLFSQRKISIYPAFKNFYGTEEAVEQIVSYYKHAAQGLEESKQILYLLGPVGSGKSSLAETLKKLMQVHPIYVLKAGDDISPVFESPLGLFDEEAEELLEQEYKIPARYTRRAILSPWAAKRLTEFGGDISKFRVVKMYPSVLNQIAVTKTEPGDENNQDISTLVGKVDIRKLEEFSQDDADAYSWKGGLNIANQGILEFVEMFKAPIKMLHPLLTATQEGHYNGTTGIGAIPFTGMVLAHSNESEWETFKNDKTNEAFIDRVCIVKVPYCLRVDEEVKIYERLLKNSDLSAAPCAPGTLTMLAQFCVLSRLHKHENSSQWAKKKVYNGENIKDTDPKARSVQEYRDEAGVNEGMNGISTRFAFKILSKVFNYTKEEIAANPVHMLLMLEQAINNAEFPESKAQEYMGYLKNHLMPTFAEQIGKELQKAYLESYSEFGQNMFDRYVMLADAWIQNNEWRDPETGAQYDRAELNAELEKIEKPSAISNVKDFRNEVVNFVLREKANNGGKAPNWTSYEKLRVVIEANIFVNTEQLLPVITFGTKKTSEDERKHAEFIDRMVARGYTERQVRLLVEWYGRYSKNR